MNKFLFELLKLLFRARLRQMRRAIMTVRGALMTVFGLCMFMIGFLPALIQFAMWRLKAEPGEAPPFIAVIPEGGMHTIVALGIMSFTILMLLIASRKSSIVFELCEIDLLFPAPFTNRELITYRLTKTCVPILITALFVSLFALIAQLNLVAFFIGTVLALVFVFIGPPVCAVVTRIPGMRIVIRALGVAMVIPVILAASHALNTVSLVDAQSIAKLVLEFKSYPSIAVVMFPFEIFGRTIVATTIFPDLIIWGGLAFLIDAALFWFVVNYHGRHIEESFAMSEKIHSTRQCIRQGGSIFAVKAPKGRIKPIPELPRFAGAGPIVWRQIIALHRTSSVLVKLIGLQIVPIGIMIYVLGDTPDEAIYAILPMVAIFMSFFLPPMVRFDFRSDLAKMDYLKTLPVHSSMIALGQILVPALLISALQCPLICATAILSGELWLLAIAFFLIPVVNFIIIAIDNAVFLVYPTAQIAASPGDFRFMARMYLTMIIKLVVLGACLAPACLAAFLVHWLTGGNMPLTFLAAWLVVTPVAIGAVPVVAITFNRFDPSTDTPV